MTSAKVIIKEQDRSAIVPAMDGVYAGVTVISSKGPVKTPRLITSLNQLLDVYGKPDPKLGTAMYSAMEYLKQGNKLWVVRSAHDDSMYSAALIRSKILPVPQGLTDTLVSDNLVVNPVLGLTQNALNSYQFPVYSTNKEYEAVTGSNIFANSSASTDIHVNSFADISVGDDLSFGSETLSALNDLSDSVGENKATYSVVELVTGNLSFDKITVATAVTVTAGTVIKRYVDGGAGDTLYAGSPTVVRSATSSTELLISNADYIANGDNLSIDGVSVAFTSKEFYSEEAKYVRVDDLVSVTDSQSIFRVVTAEVEDRDAFLVTSANQGIWGNKLSIGIAKSNDYADAFNLIVYFDGVLVESWEVTLDDQLDGYNRQLEIEKKINGKSAYINVLSNGNNVDSEGKPKLPLVTDYSLWSRTPEDLFTDSTYVLAESLVKGHVEVKLDAVTNLSIGDRIKFVLNETTNSKEYKVLSINSGSNSVIVDRPIEEEEIPVSWVDTDSNTVPTSVLFFDNTFNDSATGVVNGVKNYGITKINNVYYNYPLNSSFVINGVQGKLLSAGANLANGGSMGSSVTVGDLIQSINKLSNKEATPVTLLMDGGFAIPAVAQAIHEVCKRQGLTHGYLSTSYSAEESVDYLAAIVADKDSTNLDTHLCSMFAGWVQVYDEFNDLAVWISPEGFAAAQQSFTTREFQAWFPAAGYERGKISGLDVKVKFTEGDRDFLVANRINPIRKRAGSGLIIWGNESMLVKPSPMQLRSVSMLLIVIKLGLENLLEFKTFELNDERTWSITSGTLDAFMRDEIKAKGGVYNYEVAIQEIITPSDIDNRRMPVFLGIQPTMDIKTIPVTLAIFNSSVDIQVSL